MAFALAATVATAWAQSANVPIGNRDAVVPSGNSFFTWGWTCDPDNWGQSLGVHFYLDGTYASGQYIGGTTANVQRGDVAGSCNGTTAHGYDFTIPTQYLTPGTHYIYAYALDNGGIGPNPLLGASPLSFTVTSSPAPSCGYAEPQAGTTSLTSGTFDLYARSVQNATSVWFAVWADSAQGDLVWYPGTDVGNGTWRAQVNMGQHYAGNPIYGTFISHVYMNNANYSNTFCAQTSFQRVQAAPPPSCTYAEPQAATTTATSGPFYLYAYGVQNATTVFFPTWANGSQQDLVWYPGTYIGGNTWRATVDLGNHFAGNPIYGTFLTHVYVYNSSNAGGACAATSFQRTQQPATYSISGRTGTPYATVSAGGISTTAAADGSYVISGLASGTYTVSHSTAAAPCKIVPETLSASIGPSRSGVDFVTQCERTWNPLITNVSRSQYRETFADGSFHISGDGAPAWVFSNFNEVPIGQSPTHPAASLAPSIVNDFFTKVFELNGEYLPNGQPKYRVKLGLNKDSNPNGLEDNNVPIAIRDGSALGPNQSVWFDTAHATAFFEDNFDVNKDANVAYPRLDEDLWIDVRATFISHRVNVQGTRPTTAAGLPSGFPNVMGMSRLVVGINVSFGGTDDSRFLEVILWRDPGYVGCSPGGMTWWGTFAGLPCQDSSGLYDRRTSWGNGEGVYLHAPQLSQVYPQLTLRQAAPVPPQLSVGSINSYTLPIGELFKWYFGSSRAALGGPASWSAAYIKGVYIGIETWGRATTYVDIDNYRLYAVRQ